MTKKIRFTLGGSEVTRAIRQLKAYSAWTKKKSDEVTQRLAQIGATVASIAFTGMMTGDEDPVTVTAEPIDNGYEVKAEGKSVCFLEFGAGLYAGAGYAGPHGEIDISPGSYSSTEGSGQYAKYNYWYYKHKRFIGVTPGHAMYDASRDIELKAAEIIREVFSS